MIAHSHHLGNNGLACPLHAKDLGQLLEVVRRRLANREDGVAQPPHAQGTQLLIEELNSELAGQQGDVLDDSQANTPLFVFGQLDDCGQQRL